MKFEQLILNLCWMFVLTGGSDDEPSIPSHMPAPPKGSSEGGGGGRPGEHHEDGEHGGNGRDPSSNHFSEIPPVPPPQNSPAVDPQEAETSAPFGLDHIILILVPQFKARIQNLPKWMGSNVKFSLPITVFFDKLKYPPPPPGPIPPSPFYGPFFPNGHYVKKRSAVVPRTSESERTSRGSLLKESIYGAERVMLIPRLENLLASFGLGGKSCLLRAICEVHEFPLQHHGYGLLGEVLTLFFSISRSSFADSHLPEYLKAEEFGKYGDCSMYVEGCPSSLFYWEKAHMGVNGSDTELMHQFL